MKKQKDVHVNMFTTFLMKDFELPIITIFKDTKDYPGVFVARLFDGVNPTEFVATSENIEDIISVIPKHLYPFKRDDNDDAAVVTSYL